MAIDWGIVMSWITRLALPIVLACLTFPALAEKRVALVIGTAAYRHAPALANLKNDAEDIAAAPKRIPNRAPAPRLLALLTPRRDKA